MFINEKINLLCFLPVSPSRLGEDEENFVKTSQPRLRGNPCQSCQGWHDMRTLNKDDNDYDV